MKDEEIGSEIVDVGGNVLKRIKSYFSDEGVTDDPKVEKAFKFLPSLTKVMHMRQHKTISDRSQAIRILPWLDDKKVRDRYIRLTQPNVSMAEQKRGGKLF